MCDSERQDMGQRRGSRRKSLLLQHQNMLQGLLVLLLFATGNLGMLHAEEPGSQSQALLDQIWMPLQPLKPVLNKQD